MKLKNAILALSAAAILMSQTGCALFTAHRVATFAGTRLVKHGYHKYKEDRESKREAVPVSDRSPAE